MAKYSLEFKIKVVEEYLSVTISYDSLADKYGIKSSAQVRNWVNSYKVFGIDGLKRSRNNSYSVKFKLRAIAIYESTEKSYREVANELGITNPSMIANWRRKYHEEGLDGLSQKRGRPTLPKNKDKSKVPETKEFSKFTDLEQANKRIKELEGELEYLEIRNKYLEHLRSLRTLKVTKQKQESSTNSVKKDMD